MEEKKKSLTKINLDLLILNLLSLTIFVFLLEEIIYQGSILSLDLLIQQYIPQILNASLTKIMIIITNIASTEALAVLSIAVLLFFLYKKNWQNASILPIAMLGGLALKSGLKEIIERTRPENGLIEVTGYSFPSGHTTLAVIFFSLMIYFFREEIKDNILSLAFVIANVLLMLGIGFSRIYLGVHWFTDVLAGYALALFWVSLIIMGQKLLEKKEQKSRTSMNQI